MEKSILIIIIIISVCIFLITLGIIIYFILNKYSCKKDDIILENTTYEIITNTNIKKFTLTDLNRDFYISIPLCLKENLPIILLFHGGGEDVYNEEGTGILNYTQFYNTNSICISFQGQISNNGNTWQNSFPWLKYNPKNDINFVQTVLERLQKSNFSKYCNFNRIYASGKSDGGGFCFYLLEYSNIPIKKIGICSSAHYTLDSENNTNFLSNKIRSVPILAVHGTGDTVMPYEGQHFLNKMAQEKAEYWYKIDPTLKNTYTLNIRFFWNYIGNLFNKKNSTIANISNNSTLINWGDVKLITAKNQNHCWMGHQNSGPDSNEISNQEFDATTLLCSFFDNIKLVNYTNPIITPKIILKSIS